jgi:hypothetical protein
MRNLTGRGFIYGIDNISLIDIFIYGLGSAINFECPQEAQKAAQEYR